MTMLDTYLSAIKPFLPKNQQHDILDELAANITAKIEDQEEALGRPLTEDEQAVLLKQLGHPALVASRYQGSQGSLAFGRQIIGPPLFPLYLCILGIALTIGLGGVLLATLLLGESLAVMLPTIGVQLLLQGVIITAIFGLAQAHLTRQPDGWDPRRPLSPEPILSHGSTARRFAALSELIVLGVILMVLPTHLTLRGAAVHGLMITPPWDRITLPIMLLTAASMIAPAVCVLGAGRPRWIGSLKATIDALWLTLLLAIISRGPWVVLRDAGAGTAADVATLHRINLSIGITLLVVVAVSAWQLLISVRRLGRRSA